MADKTWKRIEREKCRELGGERSGPTGRDTPDCDEGVHVALEIKSYKTFVFLTKDWQQAVDNAAKVGKPPVLAVKERGHNGRDMVQLQATLLFVLSGCDQERFKENWALVVDGERAADGGTLVRVAWKNFVRLYHAAYTDNNKE